MRGSTIGAMMMAVALALPSGALAGLKICNDTDDLRVVAIGYERDGQEISEGWWALPPEACQTVLVRDLTDLPLFALAKGGDTPPAGEGRAFCVSSSAFTIVRAGDCAERGHRSAGFHAVPLPEGEADATLALSDFDRAAADTTRVLDDAVFRSCELSAPGGEPSCVFHAGGVRHVVDSETPAGILDQLDGLAPATPLRLRGQVQEMDDLHATAVLSGLRMRAPSESDLILQGLQGAWVSADDPNEEMRIVGAEKTGRYDGIETGTDFLSVGDSCGDLVQGGPFLRATDSKTRDVYCYAVEAVAETGLSLRFLPRGNLLAYRRKD